MKIKLNLTHSMILTHVVDKTVKLSAQLRDSISLFQFVWTTLQYLRESFGMHWSLRHVASSNLNLPIVIWTHHQF